MFTGTITKLSYLPDMQLSFSNLSINVGKTIEIPIKISNLFADGSVISYQFNYNFDSSKLEYIGNSLTSTLAENGSLQVNTNIEGKLSIAWARQTPMKGTDNGIILSLKFKVIDAGTTMPTITNALFNTDTIKSISNGTITSTNQYGDIDANDIVQAYDAALAIQYSVGLDPIPAIDVLPWENWRINVANVDGAAGVTANDASDILKYTVGLISTFPVENTKKSGTTTVGDVSLRLEKGEVIFTTSGELFGLNVRVNENFSVLDTPQVLVSNVLSATNINTTNYAIGIAMSTAPADGTTIMKIPATSSTATDIVFDMIVNTTVKKVTIGITTGLITIEDVAVVVYPNLANDILHIQGVVNANVQVFDLSGKMLINKQNTANQIDISNLQPGIYTVKINDATGTAVKKFVKQ